MNKGRFIVVGMGPYPYDLITLRGLQLVQDADTILQRHAHPNIKYSTKADSIILDLDLQPINALLERITEDIKSAKLCLYLFPGDPLEQSTDDRLLDEIFRLKIPIEAVRGISLAPKKNPYNTFQPAPLDNQRILVLRELEQSKGLLRLLQNYGADAILFPVLSFEALSTELKVINAEFLRPFTAVCLTSANGASFFMEALLAAGLDARNLHRKMIYAVGAKTAAKLQEYGISADKVPDEFSAEGLLKSLPCDLSQQNFLLPVAEIAKETLVEGLRARGAQATVLKTYKTHLHEPEETVIQNDDWVIFTSPSSVHHFFSCKQSCKKNITAFSIGASTAEALKSHCHSSTLTVPEATAEAIVAFIVEYKYKKTKEQERNSFSD